MLSITVELVRKHYIYIYFKKNLSHLLQKLLTFGIACRNLIWPVTSVGFTVKSQSFRTIEHESTTIDTVFELPAVLSISYSVISELMGTIICSLCRFFNKENNNEYIQILGLPLLNIKQNNIP